jgi:Phage integrase family
LTVAESLTEVSGRLVWGTPKSHQSRQVPIPRSVADLLIEVMAGKAADDLVFTTWHGKPLRNLNWRRDVFGKATADAGLEGLTPHELRHTAASLAVSWNSDSDPRRDKPCGLCRPLGLRWHAPDAPQPLEHEARNLRCGLERLPPEWCPSQSDPPSHATQAA